MKKAIHYARNDTRVEIIREKYTNTKFTPETEWVMPDELKDLNALQRNSR